MFRLIHPLSALFLACLYLASCAALSTQPDPSRFFTLTPLPQAEEAVSKISTGSEQISLGIGPVKLPGYLDRQELVTRISQNRFDVSENDRWAEPLENNFTRTLSQNLSALLQTDRIIGFPWQNNQRPKYQVEIEVLRFEPNAAREALLVARWTVIDVNSRKLLSVKESRLTRQAREKSTEASVAALSEVLGALSQEIADAIRAIGGGKGS